MFFCWRREGIIQRALLVKGDCLKIQRRIKKNISLFISQMVVVVVDFLSWYVVVIVADVIDDDPKSVALYCLVLSRPTLPSNPPLPELKV